MLPLESSLIYLVTVLFIPSLHFSSWFRKACHYPMSKAQHSASECNLLNAYNLWKNCALFVCVCLSLNIFISYYSASSCLGKHFSRQIKACVEQRTHLSVNFTLNKKCFSLHANFSQAHSNSSRNHGQFKSSALNAMKCFAMLFVCWLIGEGFGQEINSLSAMSLISPQLEFLESKCYNRTNNVTVFEELKETIDDCQSLMLNGTKRSLTYHTLVHTDPKEFFDFYIS